MKWDASRLAVAVLFAAGFGAYANSFSGAFVFDDQLSIVENPTIRHLGRLGSVLSPPAHSGMTVAGRPVLNLSLAINYAMGGTEVWGYHAVNLAIHTLAGLTLFGILLRTFRSWDASSSVRSPGFLPEKRVADNALHLSLAIAVLWMVHPLQTESVTYVIQRAESLMGLFYLLTLYCFIRAADDRLRGSGGRATVWFALACAACLFGMATKEVMVTAPLMVWLYDRTFVSGSFRKALERHRGVYIGLASTWVLLGYLAVGAGARGNSVGLDSEGSWAAYALTQFSAVAHYLGLSFWPHPLVLDYGTGVAGGIAKVAPQLAVVAVLLGATLVALWRWPRVGLCGAWFFAILAPSSSVIPIVTEPIAEHRMYLSLAGVVSLTVFGVFAMAGRRGLAALMAVALVSGILTAERNRAYGSAMAIWSDTVERVPGSWRAHRNLADEWERTADRREDAVAQYREAVRLNPDQAEVRNSLARALARVGRLPEAIGEFEEALLLRPDYAEAHDNLGIALEAAAGREGEAIPHFEAALRINPDYAEAHYNLANALAGRRESLPEAIEHYRAALRIRPDYVEAHNNLANALASIPGGLPEAVEHYEAALRLRPDSVQSHFNLAIACERLGRMQEAADELESAVKLDPGLVRASEELNKIRAAGNNQP